MTPPTTTKCWVMARPPTGLPTYLGETPTFVLTTRNLPELISGQVLVEALYLSNDPSQRTWMSPDLAGSYMAAIECGSVMRARGIVKILQSTSPRWTEGQLGYGPVGWSEYGVLDGDAVRPLSPLPPGVDVTHHIGTLGRTGMTAYYGLMHVVGARKGETVLISGAAGATGSMAVRIARHLIGAGKVIGITGSDEKCRWVEKLGADACLNYKHPTFQADLAKLLHNNPIDVYFDNVGGEMLDTVLAHMGMNGRVALCGAISMYNTGAGAGGCLLRNYGRLITMRLTLHGFVVHDFANDEARRAEFMQAMLGSKIVSTIAHGEIQDTVVAGALDDIPRIWLRLFDGTHQGKLITKLDR